MKLFFQTLLATALIVFGAPQIVTAQEQRVIIVDASGSMRAKSYSSRRSPTRMDQAKLIYNAYIDHLADEDDPVPTAVHIFGSKYNWDDELKNARGQFTSPSNYPITGKMCRDVKIVTDFSVITDTNARDIKSKLKDVTWNGMTPIHISLNEALKLLKADAQNELVMISDFDEPNCLPPGVTICEMIAPQLERFKSAGGGVRVTVLETPFSKLRESLAECLNITGFPLKRDDDDHDDFVKKATDRFSLTPELIAGGPNNLDPNGVQLSGLNLTAKDTGTDQIIHGGPVSEIKLPKGTYELVVTDGAQEWQATATLSQDSKAPITVSPGVAVVNAVDGTGRRMDMLQTLNIKRPGGAIIQTLNNVTLPTRLNLANGRYELTATSSTGQAASAQADLTLGKDSNVRFAFAAQTNWTQLSLNLLVSQPTLKTNTAFAPIVRLIDPSGTTQQITNSGLNKAMAPGTYTVVIDGSTSGGMAFTIPNNGLAMDVTVEVTPGWFVAESKAADGKFELLDAAGEPLFQFNETVVQHSLPNGQYELVFVGRDQSRTSQKFSILTGVQTILNPF